MTWTYGGDPSDNDRDEVRFLVGDVDTADQQITDEEIAYAVANEANNLYAAARIALTLASKFARKANLQVGDLRKSFRDLQANYLDLAQRLRIEGAKSGTVAYAGGISISDKDAVREDSDRVQPRFSRGQFEQPGIKTEKSLLAE